MHGVELEIRPILKSVGVARNLEVRCCVAGLVAGLVAGRPRSAALLGRVCSTGLFALKFLSRNRQHDGSSGLAGGGRQRSVLLVPK